MKTNPESNDERLGKSLRQWRVDAPLPPRFQEQVWRRIEQEDAAAAPIAFWPALQALVAQLFARRAFALAYLTVALLLGSGLGFWQARQQTDTYSASLGQRYVQSIDPYLKLGN